MSRIAARICKALMGEPQLPSRGNTALDFRCTV